MDDFAEVGETVFGVKKRLRFIRSALESHQRPTVLDIGCGTGELVTLPLARHGWHITAMDVHVESIAHGNAAGVEREKFICGHLSNFDGEEKFDVIILSEVLEHVADPFDLLCQSRNRVADGGSVIVTVPSGFGPFEIDQWLWKRNFLFITKLYDRYAACRRIARSDLATLNEFSPHINFFTQPRLKQLFQAAGFRIERYQPRTFLAGSYSSIFCRLLEMARIPTGWLVRGNARVCDVMPAVFASGWMFVCRPVERPAASGR